MVKIKAEDFLQGIGIGLGGLALTSVFFRIANPSSFCNSPYLLISFIFSILIINLFKKNFFIFEFISQGLQFWLNLVVKITNFLVLTTVYFLGIGLTSLLAKISRHQFLNLDHQQKSLWDSFAPRTGKKEILQQF